MTGSGKSKKRDQDINIGKKYSMRSKILKAERPYWVYLPNSYDESNNKQRYPVLYLLDGDAHFQSMVRCAAPLRGQDVCWGLRGKQGSIKKP
jgi:predicted alpha/beta superfamily hydrolase